MNLSEILPILAIPAIILLYALYVIIGHYRAKKREFKRKIDNDPVIQELERELERLKED